MKLASSRSRTEGASHVSRGTLRVTVPVPATLLGSPSPVITPNLILGLRALSPRRHHPKISADIHCFSQVFLIFYPRQVPALSAKHFP